MLDSKASTTTTEADNERDEIQEVQNLASRDTRRIHRWRVIVTFCVVVTAAIIIFCTYRKLESQEEENFKTAVSVERMSDSHSPSHHPILQFEQFARALHDSAVSYMDNARANFLSLNDLYSDVAAVMNATWPFYRMPNLEHHATSMLKRAGGEIWASAHIVQEEQRNQWNAFVAENYEPMIFEGEKYSFGNLNHLNGTAPPYFPDLFFLDEFGQPKPAPEPPVESPGHFAFWSFAPSWSFQGFVNFDVLQNSGGPSLIDTAKLSRDRFYMGGMAAFVPGSLSARFEEVHEHVHSEFPGSATDTPHASIYHPIFENNLDRTTQQVASSAMVLGWDISLRNLLPDNVRGIQAVVHNSCNESATYEIRGKEAFFRGYGDFHDVTYDDTKLRVSLHEEYAPPEPVNGACKYWMNLYPTREFESVYATDTPRNYAVLIAVTFAVIVLTFYIYDALVQRRNTKLVINAARSNAIVSSMFPGTIRDRIIGSERDGSGGELRQSTTLKQYMQSDGDILSSKPLADLFTDVTVVFADIVGFTAWSSVREPIKVFTLLETLYAAFDLEARRCSVYKVETVGDCYVGVGGLPNPSKDHAVACAKFARRILKKMEDLTKRLEVTLGPDTGSMTLRIGIHSGNVTAGVLRGERPRFQLFGDTMNVCSRMEQTGQPARIQLSKVTAELLILGGKESWLQKRKDAVAVKGRGHMETFWLTQPERGIDTDDGASHTHISANERLNRLIDWNVEQLSEILKLIIAGREAVLPQSTSPHEINTSPIGTPFEEVEEVIMLPEFNRALVQKNGKAEDIEIPPATLEQLHELVSLIAGLYRDNPFHNFQHASHVVMSVVKLMSRIVAPSHLDVPDNRVMDEKTAASLHDYTFGITSDPLTQFACAFSALIHDADHTGVPNGQVIAENPDLGARYDHRSVAEQNSLDLAWGILVDERFSGLLGTLCATAEELTRFRKLVVNSVLATDIMDRELKALRNGRWEKAFDTQADEGSRLATNRKATIVIEHIIQASDVAHTMQHWHVYRKWNERLFEEMYRAYRSGRSSKDPSEFWYRGEIGFFDFYIIPLARKLKDCGVFGVSSDEYLNYALQNRAEWEARGQEVVAKMVNSLSTKVEGDDLRMNGVDVNETASFPDSIDV